MGKQEEVEQHFQKQMDRAVQHSRVGLERMGLPRNERLERAVAQRALHEATEDYVHQEYERCAREMQRFDTKCRVLGSSFATFEFGFLAGVLVWKGSIQLGIVVFAVAVIMLGVAVVNWLKYWHLFVPPTWRKGNPMFDASVVFGLVCAAVIVVFFAIKGNLRSIFNWVLVIVSVLVLLMAATHWTETVQLCRNLLAVL